MSEVATLCSEETKMEVMTNLPPSLLELPPEVSLDLAKFLELSDLWTLRCLCRSAFPLWNQAFIMAVGRVFKDFKQPLLFLRQFWDRLDDKDREAILGVDIGCHLRRAGVHIDSLGLSMVVEELVREDDGYRMAGGILRGMRAKASEVALYAKKLERDYLQEPEQLQTPLAEFISMAIGDDVDGEGISTAAAVAIVLDSALPIEHAWKLIADLELWQSDFRAIVSEPTIRDEHERRDAKRRFCGTLVDRMWADAMRRRKGDADYASLRIGHILRCLNEGEYSVAGIAGASLSTEHCGMLMAWVLGYDVLNLEEMCTYFATLVEYFPETNPLTVLTGKGLRSFCFEMRVDSQYFALCVAIAADEPRARALPISAAKFLALALDSDDEDASAIVRTLAEKRESIHDWRTTLNAFPFTPQGWAAGMKLILDWRPVSKGSDDPVWTVCQQIARTLGPCPEFEALDLLAT